MRSHDRIKTPVFGFPKNLCARQTCTRLRLLKESEQAWGIHQNTVMPRSRRRWLGRQLSAAMDDAAVTHLHADPRNYRCLWILLMVLTMVGSLLPLNVPSTTPVPGDKLQHFLGYGLLATMATLGFSRLSLALGAALAMIGLGAAVEGIQHLLPWRQFDWLDMLANTLGVACGIGLGLVARLALSRYTHYPR